MGFLYKVVESLQPAPMWIFKPRKDISWVECSKMNLWRLLMKSFKDWSCLVVPRKIRKMSSMDLYQEERDWQPMESLAYGGVALVSMAMLTVWRKCSS